MSMPFKMFDPNPVRTVKSFCGSHVVRFFKISPTQVMPVVDDLVVTIASPVLFCTLDQAGSRKVFFASFELAVANGMGVPMVFPANDFRKDINFVLKSLAKYGVRK